MAIRPARIPEEIPIIRQLIREFHNEIDLDLTFQNFEKELASLPGCYSQPTGGILLSFDGEDVTGCVGFRPFKDDICEMKRLYVRPKYRGCGHGKLLAKMVIEEARKAGYKTMYLDTVGKLTSSVAMYRSLGFVEIEPYYFSPLPDTFYFSLQLREDEN